MLNVDASETVASVKAKLHDSEGLSFLWSSCSQLFDTWFLAVFLSGYSLTHQHLFLPVGTSRILLEDAWSLEACRIQRGSTLQLSLDSPFFCSSCSSRSSCSRCVRSVAPSPTKSSSSKNVLIFEYICCTSPVFCWVSMVHDREYFAAPWRAWLLVHLLTQAPQPPPVDPPRTPEPVLPISPGTGRPRYSEDRFVNNIYRFPPANRIRPNSSIWWTQVYSQPEFPSYEPLVTILTPSFGSNPVYFHQLALCLLQQTFTLWEWIIVNDGWKDHKIFEDLFHWMEQLPFPWPRNRVKVVHLPKNSGLAGSFIHLERQAVSNLSPEDPRQSTSPNSCFGCFLSFVHSPLFLYLPCLFSLFVFSLRFPMTVPSLLSLPCCCQVPGMLELGIVLLPQSIFSLPMMMINWNSRILRKRSSWWNWTLNMHISMHGVMVLAPRLTHGKLVSHRLLCFTLVFPLLLMYLPDWIVTFSLWFVHALFLFLPPNFVFVPRFVCYALFVQGMKQVT